MACWWSPIHSSIRCSIGQLYMFVDSELIQVDQKANYSIGREMDNKWKKNEDFSWVIKVHHIFKNDDIELHPWVLTSLESSITRRSSGRFLIKTIVSFIRGDIYMVLLHCDEQSLEDYSYDVYTHTIVSDCK